MSRLRTLLIDCRIALRSGADDASREALTERIDEAIQTLWEPVTEDPVKSKPSVTHKVALAWQVAVRGLKLTHPQLYEQLHQRMMGILDTRTPEEPTDELLRLEGEVEKLRRDEAWVRGELDRLQVRAAQTQGALEALQNVLAEAVPDLTSGDDPQQFAQMCIQELVRASKRTGPGIKGDVMSGQENVAPPRVLVEQVAAGTRHFSSEQRGWTISEAMCLTGWEFTPIELTEKGDAWLAKLLLEKGDLQ